MRSPIQAMLWELWRSSRMELLIRLGGLIAAILFIRAAASTRTFTDYEHQVIHGVLVMFLTMGSIASQTWLRELDRQNGFSFRLGFVRPLSTRALVAIPMAYSTLTAILCYLIPVLFIRLLSGSWIPLAGPVTIVAFLVPCCMAATWSPTTIAGKIIAFMVVGVAACAALGWHHSQHESPAMLMSIGTPGYFDFGLLHYLLFVATTIAAYCLTVWAVARQRRGDSVQLVHWQLPTRLGNRHPTRPQSRFTSRFAAQCWFEWKRCGPIVFLIAAIVPSLLLTISLIASWLNPTWSHSPWVWIPAMVFCPFVYQLIATEGAVGLKHRQGVTWMSVFDATRSMPNDLLITSKLVVIAVCSAGGWLLMLAGAGCHMVLCGTQDDWARVATLLSNHVGTVPAYWWWLGLSNAALLYISSTSMLLAFGLWAPLHGRVLTAISFSGVALLLLAIWDSKNGWSLGYLWTALGYVGAVLILTACLITLSRALFAGYLGKRLFACGLALWMVYVSAAVVLFFQSTRASSISPVVIFLGIAMLLVPLATTAIAPLALASHRHA